MAEITTTFQDALGRDWQIEYDRRGDQWIGIDPEGNIRRSIKLSALESAINTTAKAEAAKTKVNFVKVNAIMSPGYNPRVVTVTSRPESSRSWVTQGGSRSKASNNELYADTPENRKKMEEAKVLKDKASALLDSLDKLVFTDDQPVVIV